MTDRILCVIVGYVCGMFLTADVVTRAKLGKHARDLGSGNPGMANVAGLLGAGWALVTLAGDILKTVLACELCRWALCPGMGQLAVLYAGFGAVLGHNYPAWTGFRGGKGVTVTCSAFVLFDPLWGFVAMLVGLAVILLSKYLPWGAIVISAAFLVSESIKGASPEVLVLCALLTLLMIIAHGAPSIRALKGAEPKVDVLGEIKKRMAAKR